MEVDVAKLRELRRRRVLSLEELAEKAGVGRNTIWRVEDRVVGGQTRTNRKHPRGDAERGLVSDGGNVAISEYLQRWLNESVRGSVKPVTHDSYKMLVNKHV